MIKKLDQLVEDVKEELGLLLSISFGVFLFILFFQPFPIVGLEFNNILLFVGGIGTIDFLIMVLIRITIPRIVRNTNDQTNGIVFPPYFKGQFDDVSWERQNKWDKLSAISGSSFLKLPAILQWFTGNIGFHHVHHLSSRIPNYNLAKCHYENEIFKDVKPIKLFSTFKALTLGLWDETNRRMISFRKLSAV